MTVYHLWKNICLNPMPVFQLGCLSFCCRIVRVYIFWLYICLWKQRVILILWGFNSDPPRSLKFPARIYFSTLREHATKTIYGPQSWKYLLLIHLQKMYQFLEVRDGFWQSLKCSKWWPLVTKKSSVLHIVQSEAIYFGKKFFPKWLWPEFWTSNLIIW